MQNKDIAMKALAAVFIFIALIGGMWFGAHTKNNQAATSASPVEPIKDVSFLLDMTFPDTLGQEFKVSDKLSKVTLINYWATWCAPCREEMPLFDTVHNVHQGDGFSVLGMTIDDAQAAELFIQEIGISYPILMAGENSWDLLVQSGNDRNLLPYSILVDEKGVVLEQKLGILHAEELSTWISKYL